MPEEMQEIALVALDDQFDFHHTKRRQKDVANER